MEAMTHIFYNGSHAVIIVYAIDMPKTFESVSRYCKSVDKLCKPTTLKVLVGNKCDLDNSRRVKKQDLSDKAKQLGVDLFFETSAMPEYKGTIDAMFNAVISKLADMPEDTHVTKIAKR